MVFPRGSSPQKWSDFEQAIIRQIHAIKNKILFRVFIALILGQTIMHQPFFI